MDRGMARETRSHARVACEGPSPTVRAAVRFGEENVPLP